MANPSQSNSISWGTIEQQNPVSVMSAFNTETLKLTSQGVTVMVSTGDNGVANFGCTCNNAKSTTSSNCACNANSGSSQSSWTGTSWTGKGYFPSFPATCPYVVAVGATMFPASSTTPEIACQSQLSGIITSGGGFSTYFATPSWQTSAVSGYFAGLKTQPSSGYNAKGRGIPDISLLGVNYQVIVRGQAVTLFGTSASAPVFAGMISLVNAGRKARGFPNVGFINPTLYEFGLSGTLKTFTDVTSGNNKCCSNGSPTTTATLCCAAGFNSSTGWDPVTGWGSVTYTNLETMLNADINPTVQPTFMPTAVPTPTPLPSRNPTFQPTPVAGSPTLAPSVNNVVTARVTQVSFI
jgi:tripeptidyl-peptidase-1